MTHQILLSLLNCSWQWGLLGGLTWLITRRFHQSNNTVHLLWLLFLISLPILFALNQFIPGLSIVQAESKLIATQSLEVSSLNIQESNIQESNPSTIVSIENQTLSNQHISSNNPFYSKLSITHLILGIWGIGTLSMLIRIVFGFYRISRIRSRTSTAEEGYQLICKRLAQQFNIRRPVTVCYSDDVVSPISFGWLAPHILIPRDLTFEQFEMVAAHELAHIQRLDWLINLFSQVVGVVFFFHPIYHLLNQKLVHLREQICDDWVIQLTGSRKKYAQCLLDLARHENGTIPLALSLNKPSWLESRIDSILKHNRRIDLTMKPRILILAASFLIICLPLLSMAQLIPIRTVPVSLFAQTSEKAEKPIDKTQNQKMLKTETENKKKKMYKDYSLIEVKDPTFSISSEEKRIFSGPQVGEKLPSFNVTGMYGEIEGKTFDITKTDRQPLMLFVQDASEVGVKGFGMVINLLLRIAEYQIQQANNEDTNQSLQIGVIFLIDNVDALPEWSVDDFKVWSEMGVMVCMSPGGREGPGSYGLNRNVAQTILISKDGKVTHNFAFTQPMLYTDPYVLGAVSQAIGVEPSTMEKWLNQKSANQKMKMGADQKSTEYYVSEIEKALMNGKMSKEEAKIKLEDLGINPERTAKLLNETKDASPKMDSRRYRNERQVKLSDPADFKKPEEKQIYSGPQPGEKLPPLKATSISGKSKDRSFDFISKAGKHPLILFMQDGNGAGLRGLYDTSRMIGTIISKSKQKLHMNVVFLGDDPEQLTQRVSGVAKRIVENGTNEILFGISHDGREGPGSYGLNRNVSQTVIIAKEGKVLYNFALTQPTVYADPHVLGAIVQTLGIDPDSAENWLNEQPAEQTRMQRQRQQMNQERIREREGEPSAEERSRRENNLEGRRMERDGDREKESALSPELLVKLFDKDKDGILNEEERMTVQRMLESGKNQNRNRRRKVEVKDPDEFNRNREKVLFSGPQPSEKLPSLMATVINGDDEGKTIDFIANANGKSHILVIQDETPLGLRGLVGFTRILEEISQKSKHEFQVQVVFLGDSPEALFQQASKIVPHIPENILLGISPDGREGPGNYGLNRNMAQTVIVAKNGIVLHNFPLAQPMLSPDPYVLGAISELIGEKPATLEEWLNIKIPIIKIMNPSKREENGKMFLKGSFVLNESVVDLDETVIQFDVLLTFLRSFPEVPESMLIIEAERGVSHEQIVKVMYIAKEAGIDKIVFDLSRVKDKSMDSNKSQEQRSKDSD
ncbi:hypothetical protein C6497_01740 [Candidatus Poribacteria bacterium]|nr:MAG: hypothetical protein C6497_01740 [Candidatus Poribacteria bacterium]